MRVITGKARGTRLVTPDGLTVRPTIDKVKEAVFSSIQFDIEGRRVLDLFAGSGQLGIEALSRGAKSCTFVDNSKTSLDAVNTNLIATKLSDYSVVYRSDAASFLSGCNDTFDIAMLDPPYSKGIINEVMPMLVKLMSDYGIIVCEHSPNDSLPERFGKFSAVKTAKYGKVSVTYYRVTEAI